MAKKLPNAQIAVDLNKPKPRILFIKPPDGYLDDEFVYPQLGPNYLQSFLQQHGFESDLAVLYLPDNIRDAVKRGEVTEPDLNHLRVLHITREGATDNAFNPEMLGNYDIVGLSVMTPQASTAYQLSEWMNQNTNLTTVIGGSHARYNEEAVLNLPERIAFDFVVPQDGWGPMLQIASGQVKRNGKSVKLSDKISGKLTGIPAPSRPLALMEKYEYQVAGVPALHTVTALGCPFKCKFCESGFEDVRNFDEEMIRKDLETIANTHKELGRTDYGLMVFDDVGLMSPKQARKLSSIVKEYGFAKWRAFTHAYLVVKFGEDLLGPFIESGGAALGLGLETGSQRTLDRIQKTTLKGDKRQKVEDHIKAVEIANRLGCYVSGFHMLYPFETQDDMEATYLQALQISKNPVNGVDIHGNPLKNTVDGCIMWPYQGTAFRNEINAGTLKGFDGKTVITLRSDTTEKEGLYKGTGGISGWAYETTQEPREVMEHFQRKIVDLRPKK